MRSLAVLALLGAVASAQQAAPSSSPPAAEPLWNGVDFAGWHSYHEKVVLPGWAIEQVQRATGVMFVFVGLITVVTQGVVIGPVVKRIGEAKGVMLGGFLRVVGNAIMAFFPRLYPAAAGSALAGIGGGVSQPCGSALLTFNAPDVPRGRIIGINQSAMSLGNIIGPLVGGFVYDRNPAWPPRVSAAVLFVMWLLSLGLTQPAKPEGPAPASGAPAA